MHTYTDTYTQTHVLGGDDIQQALGTKPEGIKEPCFSEAPYSIWSTGSGKQGRNTAELCTSAGLHVLSVGTLCKKYLQNVLYSQYA